MKKLLLLAFAVLTFGCSKDDDNNDKYGLSCDDKVFGFNATPAENNTFTYSLVIGFDSEETSLLPVNNSTFLFYQEESNSFTKVICYDGPK